MYTKKNNLFMINNQGKLDFSSVCSNKICFVYHYYVKLFSQLRPPYHPEYAPRIRYIIKTIYCLGEERVILVYERNSMLKERGGLIDSPQGWRMVERRGGGRKILSSHPVSKLSYFVSSLTEFQLFAFRLKIFATYQSKKVENL